MSLKWGTLELHAAAPGFLDSLGMMQRTKWGWVLRRLAINLFRFSCICTQRHSGKRCPIQSCVCKSSLIWTFISFTCFQTPFWSLQSNLPCVTVTLSGRKLLSSSYVWFQPLDRQLEQQHKQWYFPVASLSMFSRFVGLSTHLRADVVPEQSSHQFVGGLLEQSHHRLIQRISILIQPAGDIVRHLQWDTNQL